MFSLSYQYEILHRYNNLVFLSKNLLPWQPYDTFSWAPKIEIYCLI